MNNRRKIIWIDTETGGLDPEKHCLLQIAAIVDQDGEILGKFNKWLKPFPMDAITRAALEKIGYTPKQILNDEKFEDPKEVFKEFEDFMGQFVNRYDSKDKFIIGGKNTRFDVEFLRKYYDKCGSMYYGSWFWYPTINLENTLAEVLLHEPEFSLKSYTLESICEFLEIPLKAHDAMEDIFATRLAYYKLTGEIE